MIKLLHHFDANPTNSAQSAYANMSDNTLSNITRGLKLFKLKKTEKRKSAGNLRKNPSLN